LPSDAESMSARRPVSADRTHRYRPSFARAAAVSVGRVSLDAYLLLQAELT
jgi:hypothetical protein